jgi:hypothetical protein
MEISRAVMISMEIVPTPIPIGSRALVNGMKRSTRKVGPPGTKSWPTAWLQPSDIPISATVMWVAYRLECLNRVMPQPRPSSMPHSTVSHSTTYEANPSVCPTRWTAWPALQSGAMKIWQ